MKKTVSVQYSTIIDLLQLIQRTTGETLDVGQLKSDWEGKRLKICVVGKSRLFYNSLKKRPKFRKI